MIKQSFFTTLVCLSIGFLFMINETAFLNSSFLYFAISGASMLVVLAFFFVFKNYFLKTIENQLISMQSKSSISWNAWISENISEFTTTLLVLSPYVLGVSALTNGLSNWFSGLNVLTYISLTVLMVYSGIMIFLLITVLYSWIFDRNSKEVDPLEH